MKKNAIRVIVDLLMFVSMCFLAGTGLLIHYRLIPGYRGGHGLTLLGLSRHEWGAYHLWAAYLLIFLVFVHLILNLNFIRNAIALGKAWFMVLLSLIGLLVVLFFLVMPIERKTEGRRTHGRTGRGRQAHQELNGDAADRAR